MHAPPFPWFPRRPDQPAAAFPAADSGRSDIQNPFLRPFEFFHSKSNRPPEPPAPKISEIPRRRGGAENQRDPLRDPTRLSALRAFLPSNVTGPPPAPPAPPPPPPPPPLGLGRGPADPRTPQHLYFKRRAEQTGPDWRSAGAGPAADSGDDHTSIRRRQAPRRTRRALPSTNKLEGSLSDGRRVTAIFRA
ncbi:hypothetical protein MPTK2_4g04220 [Marchantia polymorpha subsp. ruderalis]